MSLIVFDATNNRNYQNKVNKIQNKNMGIEKLTKVSNGKSSLSNIISPTTSSSSTSTEQKANGHTKNGVNMKMTKENIYPILPQQKSLLVAYLLWLFGGIFGLHHLYLHRDRHAFVWWCTLGGYFGVGWLSEIYTLPSLVRDANEDPRFVSEFVEKLQTYKKPAFSTNRFLGAIMVGYLWGQVAMIAIPEENLGGIDWSYLHWVIPFFAALGVWTVGNIGREKGVLWHCLVAAYLTYPIRYFVYDETYWFTAMVFVSAIVFDSFSKQWRRNPPKRYGKMRRTIVLTSAICIYLSLWSCYFVFNGKITDTDGDEVPVYEAIKNFIKSPWWTDLKQTFEDTWQFAKHNGWYETWKQIIDTMDADGEQNAYKVLNVSPTASQTEITLRWRKLSRENHPDKIKDPSKQREAQERFMEIQQAYEIISKIKAKRRSRNKKFDEEL